MLGIAGVLVALSLFGPGAARAGQCGLPNANPLWIDYVDGTVPFRSEFARFGALVATQGGPIPLQLRQAGAETIYWEMHFTNDVGTPAAPAAPGGVVAAADALYAEAAASSGCATPLIALNEVQGVTDSMPLSAAEQQYRADVLAFVQELASRGALPYLLLASAPNMAGGAASWWQMIGSSASLVREVYVGAPAIIAQGPYLGSRTLRMKLRQAVESLAPAGIPAAKIGLMLGFQSSGTVGRDGLEPLASWLEFVKLDTLAAQQVAVEQSVGSLWAWGWGTLSPTAGDPDKATAACVALWTRNPTLCDAPSLAAFDTSLSEGQISAIPASADCVIGGQTLSTVQLQQATQLLGSRSTALTALLERIAATALVPVNRPEVMQAETRMFPNPSRFLSDARAAGVTPGFARGVITDQLRYSQLTQSALLAEERQELSTTVCRDDVLPTPGDIRLAPHLPFLAAVPSLSAIAPAASALAAS